MAYSELANWDGTLTRKRAFPTVTGSQASMAKTMKKPEATTPHSISRKMHSNDNKIEGGDEIAIKTGTRRHGSTSYSGGEGFLVSHVLRALERRSLGQQSAFPYNMHFLVPLSLWRLSLLIRTSQLKNAYSTYQKNSK